MTTGKIIHYYRRTEPSHSLLPSAHEELKSLGYVDDSNKIVSVETESCFNVGLSSTDLTSIQREKLEWLLAETFEPEKLLLEKSSFDNNNNDAGSNNSNSVWQVEFGPRLTFTSAFSSNASSICQACDLPISRLELSRRYRFVLQGGTMLSDNAIKILRQLLHDRMTEEEYKTPLTNFESGAEPQPVTIVPIMEQGRAALEKINAEKGLGFDDFDLDYYTNLFKVSYYRY